MSPTYVLPTSARSTAIANRSQVQAAVKCAYDVSVKVTVRSGGHSYGAYGLAGTMIIDLVEFQDVTLDSSNIASVGGGVRLGNLATKIYDLNKRAYVPSLSLINPTSLTRHIVSPTAPAPPSVSAGTPRSVALATAAEYGDCSSTQSSSST